MARFIIASIMLVALLLTACAMPVSELARDKERHEGKTVSVSGIVKTTVKIGDISGYVLKDKETDDAIAVRAKALPAEGDVVTAKGVWVKDSLFGYYLKTEE